MRIAGTVQDSIVDGPGFRFVVFTQGCPHGCEGCHNPETHDPSGGYTVTVPELLAAVRNNPLLDGVTFSGGEPFTQPEALCELADGARALGLNVWAYSGFTFEELAALPDCRALLEKTDVLIDGPFVKAKRTLALPYRGSTNQRVIDVRKSLDTGQVVLYEL